jgi:hypothetical protein
MVMRFKGARREECVQMPRKMATSAARQPFGLPKVTAAASAAHLSCQNAAQKQNSCQFESHLENNFLAYTAQGEGTGFTVRQGAVAGSEEGCNRAPKN